MNARIRSATFSVFLLVLAASSAIASPGLGACVSSAKAAFQAAGASNPWIGVAQVCSNGSTAEQVRACIPAAKEALREMSPMSPGALIGVAQICSGGTTPEQVRECVPAAKAAFQAAGATSSWVGVPEVCSGGTSAAQARECIPAAISALRGSFPSGPLVGVAQICSGGRFASCGPRLPTDPAAPEPGAPAAVHP